MNERKTDATAAATDEAKTRARYERIAKEVYRFTSRASAQRFASRATGTLWVMLGDDERFWVTTPANCAALERMGYEYAN